MKLRSLVFVALVVAGFWDGRSVHGDEWTPEQRAIQKKAVELNSQALQLYQQGQSEKAIRLLEEVLQIRESLYPREMYPQGHSDLAFSLNNLGTLLQAQGDYSRALPYLQQALEMRESRYPRDRYPHGHPDLAQSLNNLGCLLQAQRETEM
jgi:tetratricopeptide (TPR) repeat protein